MPLKTSKGRINNVLKKVFFLTPTTPTYILTLSSALTVYSHSRALLDIVGYDF
jgi:hypothetical protein